MDEESKRIEIDDLPRAEEELTDEEAKGVTGGVGNLVAGNRIGTDVKGNTVGGTLGSITGNTIGGSLVGDLSNPAKP